ncbi:hypothetical protein AB0N77_09490 [Streptomyces misionensis]|uniref:hypothetical protein n=1 Tax=Streptomyces misionensis TaxID=67331 RepID=UPI00341D63A7
MADEDGTWSSGDKPTDDDASQNSEVPNAEFRMELWDSLPGGKAVIGVEQEGEFVWIASRQHVSEQARDEFVEQLTRIVREGLWVQNWPGR